MLCTTNEVQLNMSTVKFKWARKVKVSYEVSSKGDKRFSAFYAIMPDGNSIEWHYQTRIKLYPSIQEGKGKPPLNPNTDTWGEYLNLWRVWGQNNLPLMRELYKSAILRNHTLSDMFASTSINQAHALSHILNEMCGYIKEENSLCLPIKRP